MLWWSECIYSLHCNHTLRALHLEGVNLHALNRFFLGRAYDHLQRCTKSLCIEMSSHSLKIRDFKFCIRHLWFCQIRELLFHWPGMKERMLVLFGVLSASSIAKILPLLSGDRPAPTFCATFPFIIQHILLKKKNQVESEHQATMLWCILVYKVWK